MIRKLIPSVLLGVFLFQMLGFTVYFQLEQAKIRKQLKKVLKEGVPKDQMRTFTFAKSDFDRLKWVKKNEFQQNGRFYDVVWKKQLTQDSIFLECVDDTQETVLFENLSYYVDVNLGSERPESPLKVLFSALKQPYLIQGTSTGSSSFTSEQEVQKTYRVNQVWYPVYLELHYPPPNRLLA